MKLKEILQNQIKAGHTTPEWLERNTILLVKSGSHAYGTNDENSDTDYKGICIPPIEYHLGLSSFHEYHASGQGNNTRNNKNDIDVAIMSLQKFVTLAAKGNPNFIEMLFTREEDIIYISDEGKYLLENKHLFLSKKVYNPYHGCIKSTWLNATKESRIKTQQEKYNNANGYNGHDLYHVIRLAESGIEILKTKNYNTYRKNNAFLKEMKCNNFTLNQAKALYAKLNDDLNRSLAESTLPEEPDMNKIEQLLVKLNQQHLAQ